VQARFWNEVARLKAVCSPVQRSLWTLFFASFCSQCHFHIVNDGDRGSPSSCQSCYLQISFRPSLGSRTDDEPDIFSALCNHCSETLVKDTGIISRQSARKALCRSFWFFYDPLIVCRSSFFGRQQPTTQRRSLSLPLANINALLHELFSLPFKPLFPPGARLHATQHR
jgi:hypothetical protein